MIRRAHPVTGEIEDYLERFYIFSCNWFGVYLHRFWADDYDGLHTHPWSSISILLAGGYNEEMPVDQKYPCGPTEIKIRRPLRPPMKWRPLMDAHRITLMGNVETWSLFIRFKRKQTWGFYNNGQWEAAPVQSSEDA